MKPASVFVLAMSISLAVHAQDQPVQTTRVIGEVADGSPSPPAPPKVLPEFTINWSTVHQKKDHRVVINKVQAPAPVVIRTSEPLSEEEIARRAAELERSISAARESGGIFTVSATIYDHKTTYVRWWNDKNEYACFSNVDWNHLGGFHEFEGRGKRYNMFLFTGNLTMEQLRKEREAGYRTTLPEIPKLPLLAEKGPSYMVVRGDEENDAAMEFIEAIHDLYAEHREELARKRLEREKNHQLYLKKQQELRDNPPPKPDIIINYWKNDPQPTHNTGEEVSK